MKIGVDVTSDFICPWCLIAERRLARAVDSLPSEVEVEIRWLPFELNPDMPPGGLDRRAYRSRKFGSWARSQELDRGTVLAGKADGVDFAYDRIERTPNTRNAHRLTWWAGRQGKSQGSVAAALLDAYFTQGLDIGDSEVLADVAESAGLDRADAARFLGTEEGTAEVENLERLGQVRGLRGVPRIEVEGPSATGALSEHAYRELLVRAVARVRDREEVRHG